MTFVKTALFHKAGEGSGGGGGGGDQHNLGWYATESALTTAHATATDGDWAIVGATDTVWVWDSDTTAWKDTGQAGIELPDQTGHSGEFLTTDGTDASWAAVNALPSQTGQSGKFLTTDGTDASWSDKPLVNQTTNTNALAIGDSSSGLVMESTAVGALSVGYGRYGTALGKSAKAKYKATALGANTTANDYTIQLGQGGTNSDAGTMKVALTTNLDVTTNYELLSADGTIPTARLTKVNSTVTLTAADWSGGSQTVTVSGVTSTGVVLVSPDPTDQSAYTSAGILCTAQAADSLTFTCSTTPTADIDVNVVML